MESTLPLDGVILHYELRGEGAPLLLLHGGIGCHADWTYAGREQFEREYRLIIPDVRDHGRSAVPNWTELPKTLTHRHCGLDTLALLDHLGIERCKAVGVSMGGNILLHIATMQPERLEAIVIVSATPYFPEQTRKVMAALPAPENHPASEWERMRRSHPHGDQQIRALWQWGALAERQLRRHELHSRASRKKLRTHVDRAGRSRFSLSRRIVVRDVPRDPKLVTLDRSRRLPWPNFFRPRRKVCANRARIPARLSAKHTRHRMKARPILFFYAAASLVFLCASLYTSADWTAIPKVASISLRAVLGFYVSDLLGIALTLGAIEESKP